MGFQFASAVSIATALLIICASMLIVSTNIFIKEVRWLCLALILRSGKVSFKKWKTYSILMHYAKSKAYWLVSLNFCKMLFSELAKISHDLTKLDNKSSTQKPLQLLIILKTSMDSYHQEAKLSVDLMSYAPKQQKMILFLPNPQLKVLLLRLLI